jgi:hypothetical protein
MVTELRVRDRSGATSYPRLPAPRTITATEAAPPFYT